MNLFSQTLFSVFSLFSAISGSNPLSGSAPPSPPHRRIILCLMEPKDNGADTRKMRKFLTELFMRYQNAIHEVRKTANEP
jgi:hypothetical protein